MAYLMEKALKEFMESLVLQRKKCPWASKCSIDGQLAELESEVRELRLAVEKNDVENMREELGDVFWDALFIGLIAEEKGLFTVKDALEEAHGKLKRRKPWVFGSETVASREDAIKRWNEIKKYEKELRKNAVNSLAGIKEPGKKPKKKAVP